MMPVAGASPALEAGGLEVRKALSLDQVAAASVCEHGCVACLGLCALPMWLILLQMTRCFSPSSRPLPPVFLPTQPCAPPKCLGRPASPAPPLWPWLLLGMPTPSTFLL